MDERLVRELRRHPVKFGKLLGFDKLTDLHDGWIREMIDSQEDRTLLGHRSSYKTTCLSIAIALIIILQPQKNTIFIRKTDNDVTDIILQVKKILESDESKAIVQRIYGLNLEVYSTMFRINTNLVDSKKGAPQLLGIGTSGSITGKHADIIFTDDIVNTRDRTSKAERERVKLLYNELQNIKHREGRIFNTGTPWHKEDAISMMPNVTRYDCYQTGLIDKEKLQELRQSMPPSLFAANYELKHIADEESLFSAPKFTDKTALIYDGIAHIDAAYGGSDSTAFTICHKVGDNFYMYGRKYKKHVDEALPDILRIHKAFKAGTIYCEKNADKGYLAKELRQKDLPTKLYSENTNKYIKIASYLRKEWSNIYFLDGTDPEYINEILDFSENAAHDDCPDSAASIIRALTNKTRLNHVEGSI
ncbi:MAG: terminase family protein [Lachnospiraceae bacterium]|nr:terminase family protein [Lachnospiraceae bacterium]